MSYNSFYSSVQASVSPVVVVVLSLSLLANVSRLCTFFADPMPVRFGVPDVLISEICSEMKLLRSAFGTQLALDRAW